MREYVIARPGRISIETDRGEHLMCFGLEAVKEEVGVRIPGCRSGDRIYFQ